MTNQQKFDRLRKLLDEASVYARAVGKLEFDMQCCAPKDGMEQAGADMAVLSDRHFRLTHTKRYAQLVTELHADSEELTPVQKKVVEHLYEAWEKEKNIPGKAELRMKPRLQPRLFQMAGGEAGGGFFPVPRFAGRDHFLHAQGARSA